MTPARLVGIALLFSLAAGAAQAQTPCEIRATPDLAACAAFGGGSELQVLRRIACLLDAFNRWRLQVIACTQQRIDEWQATVMWPTDGLRAIRAALRRVRTLREEVEGLADSGWNLTPEAQALAAIYSSPRRVDRDTYEAAWGASTGTGSDVQDFIAWNSTLNRNVIQGRTNASFGLAGELPESTWERIGREGAKTIAENERDPLSAIRHTPQMVTDRLRVDASTTRMNAQALITGQLRRDYRRLLREREQHLGTLMLDTLTGSGTER